MFSCSVFKIGYTICLYNLKSMLTHDMTIRWRAIALLGSALRQEGLCNGLLRRYWRSRSPRVNIQRRALLFRRHRSWVEGKSNRIMSSHDNILLHPSL